VISVEGKGCGGGVYSRRPSPDKVVAFFVIGAGVINVAEVNGMIRL
jgi:hypothetical protein